MGAKSGPQKAAARRSPTRPCGYFNAASRSRKPAKRRSGISGAARANISMTCRSRFTSRSALRRGR